MNFYDDVKNSGVFTILLQRSKYPFVSKEEYDGIPGNVVYSSDKSEWSIDSDGYKYIPLDRATYPDEFILQYPEIITQENFWGVVAVLSPDEDKEPNHLMIVPDEDCYPDVDPIRVCEDHIYWDDDEWNSFLKLRPWSAWRRI